MPVQVKKNNAKIPISLIIFIDFLSAEHIKFVYSSPGTLSKYLIINHNLKEVKFKSPFNEATLIIKTQTSNNPQNVVNVSLIGFAEKLRKKSIIKNIEYALSKLKKK
jgi:hypothetical protein